MTSSELFHRIVTKESGFESLKTKEAKTAYLNTLRKVWDSPAFEVKIQAVLNSKEADEFLNARSSLKSDFFKAISEQHPEEAKVLNLGTR